MGFLVTRGSRYNSSRIGTLTSLIFSYKRIRDSLVLSYT
jgi:hypothetical protein